jgi:hypothetical protein
MTRLYILLTFAVALTFVMSSCSSSRNAQNTDDIYYSSGGSKVAARSGANNSSGNNDEYYSTAPSDNYIRMKAQDPSRWSYFDDYSAYDSYYSPASRFSISAGYGYGYPAYSVGYGMGFGSPFGPAYGYGIWDPYFAWNSYYMWNSWYNPYFYNPYYGGCVIVGKGTAATGVYSHLRPFNSVAYNNGLIHTTSSGSAYSTRTGNRLYRPGMTTTSAYNSGLNGQGTRPVNNTYYRPSNPGNNNNYYRPSNNNNTYRPVYQPSSQPVRTYSPAPSMGGGGGGGFSRPGRH